ncbi:hypothetical protein HDV00_001204 [Rhizophlyctis rosea]|nr:hypothetical protein HDV00_001204 [Rhizophlyctis rosea]
MTGEMSDETSGETPGGTLTDQVLRSAVLQLLRNGRQPQAILNDVFEIIDEELDTGESKLVLYNTCYGGFRFSDEFEA